MKGNYEFNELNGSRNFNLAAKAADLYESVPFREIRNEVAKFLSQQKI